MCNVLEVRSFQTKIKFTYTVFSLNSGNPLYIIIKRIVEY